MCGVFGYIGKKRDDLSDFLLEGLTKLEYRGYDSAGIAILDGEKVKIVKETGEIKRLKNKLKNKTISGSVGIGHTRWATHGGATVKNSHPHTDCTGKIIVVHNGIIENYAELKNKLKKIGHKFVSETDTEVFAHLVEEKRKKVKDFRESVRLSFNELMGLNAVVVLAPSEGIVVFRKGSPLVIGIGEDGNFVSSDIPALTTKTQKIVFLEEEQGALLYPESVLLINSKTGKLYPAIIKEIKMEEASEDMAGFDHFMMKEVFEQPEVIRRIAAIDPKEVKDAAKFIMEAWGTYFTACGTAAHAGLAATYFFSEIAKRHVNFAVGSEFPFLEDFLVGKSLLIAASQSGETMDTLEAVRMAKRHNSKVLSLVNVPGSSLERLSDKTILLKAGPERAVLSTKAYMAKLALFLLLAYTIDGKYKEGIRILKQTAKAISDLLQNGMEKSLKSLSKKLLKDDHVYIIGRGVNYPTALEGALKIKEASYIHAEGFAGGELKHGVIALIDKGTPAIAIVANDRAKESVLSNAIEMSSRGGFIIGIAPENHEVFDVWIKVPDVKTASPLVNIVPMQILAYHLTILKGLNPDKPRNLAKSVTVK